MVIRGEGSATGTATGSQHRRTRRRILQAGASVGAVSLAGCLESTAPVEEAVLGTTDDEDDEPITIGVLAPHPDSDFVGRSMVRAAEIAVTEIADDGGILGRDVELAVGNTAANPLEARREYHRLVLEEGADVTVGVFDSPALVNILDDIAEQETIHLTTGAATTAASQHVREDYERYKYHFRVGPTNEYDLGRAQIDFLDDVGTDIGWDSVALLAEDYEWTEAPWEIAQNQLAGTGLDVAMDQRYPPATDDFSNIYDEVEATGADVVLITAAHTGTDAILDWVTPSPRAFAFGGIHVPLQLPTYYEQTNGACRYAVGQTSATPQTEFGDRTQDFVAAYQNAYDGSNPVYTGYHTYDAVSLFAHVVEATDSLETDALVEGLEDVTDYTGTVGTVEFYDRDHDHPHDLVYQDGDTLFFQWQEEGGEGVQEVIWPEEHATADYVEPEWL